MTRLETRNCAIGALLVAGSMSLSFLLMSCGGGGGGGGGSGPPPPVTNPTLSSVNPIVATAGSAGFTLTANGADFTQSSQVVFNGSVKTTTFRSASQLTAAVSASDVAQASPGAGYPVTVQTGSSVTSAVHFFVVPPVGPPGGVSVSAGGITHAATIQVVPPPGNPSTPLSLTDAGVGSAAGVTGGEVKQGTSATLLLVGNGIVPGTFYVVTGGQGDITVKQPLAPDFSTCSGSGSGGGTSSTPCVKVSVSVSATAAPGPRNLIVTNPAGELAAFVGGLLITQ